MSVSDEQKPGQILTLRDWTRSNALQQILRFWPWLTKEEAEAMAEILAAAYRR
jgi:hypothetical protein